MTILKSMTHLWIVQNTTIIVAAILTNIKNSKTVSSITHCQQSKAKETSVIVLQCSCFIWALNSYVFPIYRTNNTLEEGGFKYGAFKKLRMACQVSLSIRLKVGLPMRYAKVVIAVILFKLETIAWQRACHQQG